GDCPRSRIQWRSFAASRPAGLHKADAKFAKEREEKTCFKQFFARFAYSSRLRVMQSMSPQPEGVTSLGHKRRQVVASLAMDGSRGHECCAHPLPIRFNHDFSIFLNTLG